jgi:hypothetical protein
MSRTVFLPLLIAIALVFPLTAMAQPHAGADATDDVVSPFLPSTAASAADDVSGGSDGDQAFQQAAAAERQRIAAGRATAYARYQQDRHDCWQRFAVNACLDRSRERRRATMDALRHDELVLNAQERQRRTAARLNEIANKQANGTRRSDSAPIPISPASVAQ